MKVLNESEVGFVSGGGAWSDLWGEVKKWLNSVFGSSDQQGLQSAVNSCVSGGGTVSFSFAGGSGTVSYGGSGTVPVDGVPVPITIKVGNQTSTFTYSGTCTGGNGGNHPNASMSNQ